MEPARAARLTFGGLLLLLILGCVLAWKIAELSDGIHVTLERQRAPTQYIQETVQRPNGSLVTVRTTRLFSGDGTLEPAVVWIQRHDTAVRQLK